ncbi:microcephalin isoform X2 [Hemiscyllium ocellatum]|uniref:microcephalin isoform X2 n=1 Tax=Hemiscyllium ocellatum TaxID=170820 RepID=UPI00296699A0|nr:microcephalin isoform X2 [Hemiscyllium ocellatum]
MAKDCSKRMVLQDVVAFVDVWSSSKTENYSKPFIGHLTDMGATVLKYFNKQVTHVVFKDGHESVWKKAKKTGVKLVSVLWVERCMATCTHVDESLFPAVNDSKSLPENKRTHRCMKPRDFIEKTPENDKRLQRKLDQMIQNLDLNKTTGPDLPLLSFDGDATDLHIHKMKTIHLSHFCRMEERLKEMKDKRENLSPTASQMSQTTISGSAASLCQPSLGESPSITPKENQATGSGYTSTNDPCGSFGHNKKYTTELTRTTIGCKRKTKKPSRTLVMTSMPSENQIIVMQVVKHLGGFLFSDQVNETTTHVVAGHPRRTLNVLFGIAQGCWILSFDWILWSLEQGFWVPEEPYELSAQFPAATICRLEKQSAIGSYRQDLFANQPLIFISPRSEPPTLMLEKLIQLCGGKVCKTLRKAEICIGQYKGKRPPGNRHLSEGWILDCITQHELCSIDNYRIE